MTHGLSLEGRKERAFIGAHGWKAHFRQRLQKDGRSSGEQGTWLECRQDREGVRAGL